MGHLINFTTHEAQEINAETSELLQIAADTFESEYSCPVTTEETPPDSNERGDFVTAIAVGSAAISALVAVLAYLKSRKPSVRYRIRRNNREIEVGEGDIDDKLERKLTEWAEDPTTDEEREFVVEVEL